MMVRNEQDFPPVQTTTDAAAVDAIVGGYHGSPFQVLGPQRVHVNGVDQLVIRTFRPLDEQVWVVDLRSGERHVMERIHPGGLYEARLPGELPFAYRLIVVDGEGNKYEIEDPYRFPAQLSEF